MPPERSSSESGPRDSNGIRKKMRKGTHSCFECRRRKIRCIFPPDNNSVCTECFARGSRCIDQEHVETDVVVDHRKNLRERVARLEALVESLVDDKSEKHAAEALRSLGGDQYPPTPLSEDTPTENPHAPVMTLFNNAVLSRAASERSGPSQGPLPARAMSIISSPQNLTYNTNTLRDGINGMSTVVTPAKAKDDRVRQALIAVLPPYHKLLITLQGNHHAWAVFQRKCPGTRGNATLEEFSYRVMHQGTPCEVGLLVILYGSCTEGDLLDQCLALVDKWIITDDEYMGTLEGLECVILQGKVYSDIGQARRSWLAFRRGVTFAQLMGLHRNHSTSIPRESIWWSLYGADRLTSLMLGMPYGINDAHCNLEFMGQNVSTSIASNPMVFFSKIAYFSGKVIDRTQGLHEATYASALDLEQELNNYAAQMAPSWWHIEPLVACDDPSVAYEWQEKVLGQIAFHQIKAYLHMPFMLKSASQEVYGPSRKACIDGSREMLRLYHLLRAEGTPLYECRAIDFIGFTACILLVLGLLGYGRSTAHNPFQDESDWALIETSMDIFKRASSEKGGRVAAQSYRALEQLHRVKNYSCEGPESDPNESAKIVIPFFGTISVQRGQSFKHVAPATSSSSPSCLTQGTPSTLPLTNPTTPDFNSVHQQAATGFSSMDPQIMYDGFYIPQTSTTGFDPQFNDESLASYIAPASNIGAWQNNVGNMDLDQDWSSFLNELQQPQQTLQMNLGFNS
ncbi:hypothetical protein EG327_011323 [Venturia inaequalis]|uniref:Zn(2)-C6 fungal-type domain-containing protein n=1 Tax=Venturia inaequalis TaxID=5025 RepID=A0A8H3VQC8_VENIN|nr:hypothetical protein EG327_011323 [Venturia inaequalis]